MNERHFIAPSCKGERCFCGQDATHKVGEERSHHDPHYNYRHNFTQYVCCQCFTNILGNATFCGLKRQPMATDREAVLVAALERMVVSANGMQGRLSKGERLQGVPVLIETIEQFKQTAANALKKYRGER